MKLWLSACVRTAVKSSTELASEQGPKACMTQDDNSYRTQQHNNFVCHLLKITTRITHGSPTVFSCSHMLQDGTVKARRKFVFSQDHEPHCLTTLVTQQTAVQGSKGGDQDWPYILHPSLRVRLKLGCVTFSQPHAGTLYAARSSVII